MKIMRRFTKSRRGLSTVVTAALMLTAVAVLGSVVVSWSQGNLNAFREGLANTASTVTNKINENLVIENVVFCKNCPPSNTVINVTLTNIGAQSLNVTQIKINSTIIQTYFTSSQRLPAIILSHQSYTVSTALPTSMSWGSKSPDTITVTTARGSIFTTQAAAP